MNQPYESPFRSPRESRLEGWLTFLIVTNILWAFISFAQPEWFGQIICYLSNAHEAPPNYQLHTPDGKPVEIHIDTHRCRRCGKLVELK